MIVHSLSCRLGSSSSTTAKRAAQAQLALLAIANGLAQLDAQLLYGFTQEELAAYRSAPDTSAGPGDAPSEPEPTHIHVVVQSGSTMQAV